VEPLASVDAPDKLTIVLKTRRPYPAIGFLLQCLNMVDPITMQQPDGANQAVGTGPFKFVEYAQGDHLTLSRNPNYWRSGLPYLDEIYYQIFSDSQSLVTQLEARVIDVADAPTLRDTVRLQNDPGYRIEVNKLTGNNYTLVFNTTQAPTNNKLVRQALQYSIDRESIVQRALLGIGSPQNLPWWPTSPAYDEAKNRTYGFDLDKAKALLQQAGAAGLQLDLNYSTAVPEQATMAQIIQADLAKIGVTITLKPLDPNQLTAQFFATSFSGLAIGGQPFAHMYPGILYAGVMTGPLNNYAGYRDEKWSAIAIDMATAVDPAKQRQAYATYNDYMLDQSWVAYISTQLLRHGTLANVHGPTFDMAQILDATEAWIG
jgi:peptide/nickel transport system substrate-binding protein